MASSVRALTSKGRLTPLCRVRTPAPTLSLQRRGNATTVPFRLPAARNEPNVSHLGYITAGQLTEFMC